MSDRQNGRRLLWADDDATRRYIYSTGELEKKGWQVVKASNVVTAAQELARVTFDFIIFDQMYPFSEGDIADVWGGCRLLCWLKGKQQPANATLVDKLHLLTDLSPVAGNNDVPLMFLSAFDDPDVRRAIQSLGAEIRMVTKPMHPEQLIPLVDTISRAE